MAAGMGVWPQLPVVCGTTFQQRGAQYPQITAAISADDTTCWAHDDRTRDILDHRQIDQSGCCFIFFFHGLHSIMGAGGARMVNWVAQRRKLSNDDVRAF